MDVDGNTSLSSTVSSGIADGRSTIDEEALKLSVTVVLALFIALSVTGNSLVCYVFYKQPNLRRVVYYPVNSLAIADLLCGLLAMPAYIAKKHVHQGGWEGFTCDTFRFTYFFTEYASVLSLMAISIERFVAVWKPVAHRTWLTRRKMTAFLLGSWLNAALVSVLPFFWRRGTDDEACAYDPTREWSLMVITTNVFAPFLVMLFCHVYTVSFALRYSRRHKRGGRNNPPGQKYPWQSETEEKDKNARKRERDITRALGLVVGIFVICWGPSTFYYFIQMVCPRCFRPGFKDIKPIFNAIVKLLTFLNSCVNPLIYYWLNRVLRNAMYESLLGKARCRKREAQRLSALNQGNSTTRCGYRTRDKNGLLDINTSDEQPSKLSSVMIE